jgi:hypothetical protein
MQVEVCGLASLSGVQLICKKQISQNIKSIIEGDPKWLNIQPQLIKAQPVLAL